MRNFKIFLTMVAFFLCANFIFPEAVKAFPEHLKPDGVYASGDRIIIKEGFIVYIYSLNDYSLIKKFGSEGEGPKEFKGRIRWVGFAKDTLWVDSIGKISYFTRDGEFIKEIRTTSPEGYGFIPFDNENKFIGGSERSEGNIRYKTLNIYDSELKIVKEIFKKVHDFQRGRGQKMFTAPQNYQTCGDRIFIAFSKDFVIDVFDTKGNKISTIEKEYEKLKVGAEHKKQVLNFFKTNPRTKARYPWFERNLEFPEYFPAIRAILAAEKKLYVRTYKKVDNKTETFIFDMDGNLVKKVFLPVYENNIFQYYSLSISNGKLYQMIENEETEVWELHVTEIK